MGEHLSKATTSFQVFPAEVILLEPLVIEHLLQTTTNCYNLIYSADESQIFILKNAAQRLNSHKSL